MSYPSQRGTKKALGHIIAAVRAFGGFSVLLTKRGKIVYASPLAKSLIFQDSGVLTNPDLVAVAKEAWKSREHVARSCQLTNLGPFQEVVLQAEVVESRWILVTVIDRTDEVKAIQIRRDFVSNIGHELRTPVTSVGLIAQALKSCSGDQAAVEHFSQRLANVAKRLERLADGMLALAHAQDPQTTQPLTRIHVSDLVDKAVFQALETARGKGVKLKTKKRVEAHVLGDEESLVSALENLLSNAIYYSPKGSRVTVTSQKGEEEGIISISVIDMGIGIDTADQERIFERFYRTDEARSHRVGGTGLGLAIVKHTALSHGGNVSVDSQIGSGSTFTLTLPIASNEDHEERKD
ncbi:MAG: hypothetical protein LBG99_07885 [Propionibacteriaceae bacterium]|jgi:two-component system sensor histidine kinase SenX3|nr:hypothetical protein [Propionibacteriaceae bacterium]